MKLTMLVSFWTVSLFVGLSYCQNDTDPIKTEPAKPPKPDVYEMHVITDIQYRYANTTVTSRVVNPADTAQEVSFTVVLPESAFITGFLMQVKDKVYEAYLKKKEEAKQEYDAAVSQGLSAGYVEQKARDSNQFTVSVNIEPHGKVNFNLTYEQLLSRSLGLYKHVVNINPGQIVRDMSVEVRINESSTITDLEVPEIKLDNDVAADLEKKQNPLAIVTRPDAHIANIRWAPTPEQQKKIAKDGINGQLIVEYDVDRKKPQEILVEDGYFVHFFAPEALKPLPKHVVFVLDYSGSMIGKKMEQLKEAMTTILSDLSHQDYFSIVIFSDSAYVWTPPSASEVTTTTTTSNPMEPSYDWNRPREDQEIIKDHIVPVTPEKIALAKEHIQTFNDFGGTNIISGLRHALKLTAMGKEVLKNIANKPEPMIVFLTDGEPNVEMSDTEEIIKKVKELNPDNVTIFSLAFGYGADDKFLKKLSLNNNGFARIIYEAADAAIQLKNFYKQIASPLLSNISFNYVSSKIDQDSATKIDFPTFFNGSEIVVAGKLYGNETLSEDSPSGELVATGANGFTTYPIVISCGVSPDFIPGHIPVPHTVSRLEKVWAYLTIQQLLDKADKLSEESEVNKTKDEALDLALKYKFVTPLTSLVVVKPNETTSVGAEQVRPGFGNGGYMGNMQFATFPQPAMMGPSSSISGYGGGFAGAAGNYPARPMSFYSTPFPSIPMSESLPAEEPEVSDMTDGVDKGTLDDLPWLYNYTLDNTTFTLPLSNGSANFVLGRNESNAVFGSCTTPIGDVGECRHLEYCILNTFYNDVNDFLPYRCDITYSGSSYIGACCPLDNSMPTTVLPMTTYNQQPAGSP